MRFKRKFNIDKKLNYYKDIFAIQSEVEDGAVYCISDGKFAVLCWNGAVYCPLEEVHTLAGLMRPDVRSEILEIIELELWREHGRFN